MMELLGAWHSTVALIKLEDNSEMRERYRDMSGQDEEKLKNQRKVFELDRTLM